MIFERDEAVEEQRIVGAEELVKHFGGQIPHGWLVSSQWDEQVPVVLHTETLHPDRGKGLGFQGGYGQPMSRELGTELTSHTVLAKKRWFLIERRTSDVLRERDELMERLKAADAEIREEQAAREKAERLGQQAVEDKEKAEQLAEERQQLLVNEAALVSRLEGQLRAMEADLARVREEIGQKEFKRITGRS